MLWSFVASLGPLITIVSSAPTARGQSSSDTLQACDRISSLVAPIQISNPGTAVNVPAKLAYDCITTVPFNRSAAVALLDSIRPYIEWQTTLSYMKHPPAAYAEKVQPPYDFWRNFDRIYDSACKSQYSNEYEFGLELYLCFLHGHDSHFSYLPNSVRFFTWGRPLQLVSISLDGISLPEVFVWSDVLYTSQTPIANQSFSTSPVSLINGQNGTTWLLEFSEKSSLQDPDALWNNIFVNLAQIATPRSTGISYGTFNGGERGAYVYPGPTTTLSFANGTTVSWENFAQVNYDLTDIATGTELYQKYLAVQPGQEQSAWQLAKQPVSTVDLTPTPIDSPMPGYPSPIIREPANQNSGYFLYDPGYEDVAVLSLPSFCEVTGNQVIFQDVTTAFLQLSVAAEKKKLIIDLSANAGGVIMQAYDVFKQLFPDLLPYDTTRFRAHEAFNLAGQDASAFASRYPQSSALDITLQPEVSSPFDYLTDLNATYQPFDGWGQLYGPHAYGPSPDNFTSLIRWNLSDPLIQYQSGGIDVSGYLNKTNITKHQPFKPDDIIMLYDGYCSSACAIFTELMRQQAGIKTIAAGGRPNRNMMQAVGGTKGHQSFGAYSILEAVGWPFRNQVLHTAEYYNATVLGQYSNLPTLRGSGPNVNARDGIRKGDARQVPLQFVYEPADCRIFFTPEMTVDVTAIWKKVADIAFRGQDGCIAGNLTNL